MTSAGGQRGRSVRLGEVSSVHAALERAAVRTVVVVLPEGARRPRWVRIEARDGAGDLAWSGGAGPGAELAAELSLSPGDYVVHAIAEGGYAGQTPLRVDGFTASPAPTRIELRRR